MAQHTWLCRRALRLQEACFSMEPPTPGQTREQRAIGVRTTINNYVRYHAAQDRAYRRASQELLQRRKERRQLEIGFASQKRQEPEEERRNAQEQRREKQQAQRDERHKTAVALDKKRLELSQLKTIKVSHDVAKLFDGLSPEQIAQIAA